MLGIAAETYGMVMTAGCIWFCWHNAGCVQSENYSQ